MSSLKHKGKGPQSMTANELREGYSVWLTQDLVWTTQYSKALLTEDADLIEKMQLIADRDVAANEIVGAYFIDIDTETGLPARYRERFRVTGPSKDLGEDLQKD
ncbi:MAG: DUF2849 domain-containing protein [Hellea sp.]|nr:DUF2849 domain-containing protein [Hellea sp.]